VQWKRACQAETCRSPDASRRIAGRQPRTTLGEVWAPSAPDLVGRDFDSGGLNNPSVADVTSILACTVPLYLDVVVDPCSRRVVELAMATNLRTELVLEALEIAIRRRHAAGVFHPSD